MSMTLNNLRKSPATHNLDSKDHRQQTELSIWIRIGLPLAFAVLAAALNSAAVRSQIQPTQVYVATQNLPAGTRLKVEHLKLTDIGGSLDRSVLITPGVLIENTYGQTGAPTLEESLRQNPRILSKSLDQGELITKSSLGGLALIEPNAKEEMVELPRTLIQGGGATLRPGQLVYFAVRRRSSQGLENSASQIGPFRVALKEIVESQHSTERDPTISLIYPLSNEGKPTEHSRQLLDAVLSGSGQFSFAIINKAINTPKIPPTNASMVAR